MMAGRATSQVVAGTSYELLVLLYRHVQADHGLPGLPGRPLPANLREPAGWFFRGDISLGMNVIPLAYDNGWHDVADLATGLPSILPADLVTAMLRPPDATLAARRRRDRDVARALAAGPPDRLLDALAAERFDVPAAAAALANPPAVAAAFTDLIERYARTITSENLETPLATAADRAAHLLAELPLDRAAERLFPQWRFHDLRSAVLIPSRAIAPFLSVRRTGDRTLIVFPIPPEGRPPLGSLAAALKAIAHPQRLEILRIAATAPITGHALTRALGVTEATVHHHTSLLRAAGLLTSHRDAHRVYHTTRQEAVDELFGDARRAIHARPA